MIDDDDDDDNVTVTKHGPPQPLVWRWCCRHCSSDRPARFSTPGGEKRGSMTYIRADGSMEAKRSVLRLSIVPEIFWGILNFIGFL